MFYYILTFYFYSVFLLLIKDYKPQKYQTRKNCGGLLRYIHLNLLLISSGKTLTEANHSVSIILIFIITGVKAKLAFIS